MREFVRSLCALDVDVCDKSSRLPIDDLFLFLLRSSVNLSLNALMSPLRTIGCLDAGVLGITTVFTCFILDCSCSVIDSFRAWVVSSSSISSALINIISVGVVGGVIGPSIELI